jgi:hypothetical protein
VGVAAVGRVIVPKSAELKTIFLMPKMRPAETPSWLP